MPQDYIDKPLTPKRLQELASTAPESEYEDRPLPRAPERAKTTGEEIGGMTGTVVDAGIGAVKGVGNTIFGLGKLVRDYTPIGRISDAILPGAFDQRPEELIPQNTAQRVGYTAEQVGEFFVPSAHVAKLGKTGAVARSVGQTMAQTNDPLASGASGALTAVIPGGSAAKRGAAMLQESAEKNVAQALGATKEWAKVEAAELAPEMLKRGVGGSRDAMLQQAKAQAKVIGQAMDEVIADAAARGTIVDGNVARQSIQEARKALMVPTGIGTGPAVPIEGAQRAIKKLDRLDKFVEQLGPAIPIEHAQRVKQAWDKIVSKSGLYGPKATASATDNADAWAIREAAGAFRKLLADASPDLATLNKEFAFWGGLRNVLKETQKRTQAQSGGLVQAGMGGAGMVTGAMSGDSLSERATNAALGGFVAKRLTQAMQSPWFRTQVAGPFKQRLADALATGHTGRMIAAVEQMAKEAAKAVPSQVSQ